MDTLNFNIVIAVSLIIGTIILMIYAIFVFHNTKSFPEIGKALQKIFLPSIAIIQGAYGCYSALNELLTSTKGISFTFFFVGGITIVWVSIDKIIKTFKGIESKSPLP